MIGPFPPPTHGMAVINKSIFDWLKSYKNNIIVINLSAENLDRRFFIRMRRFPIIVRALAMFAKMNGLRGAVLYMSVSGGPGQIYETIFSVLARIKNMRMFLHHHSFAYLNKYKLYTKLLVKTLDASAINVTLSKSMSSRLERMYKTKKGVSISNSVFCCKSTIQHENTRCELSTVGFISNISEEKGVLEFLDLMEALEKERLSLQGLLAGPFQDYKIKEKVYDRIKRIKNVSYVGPKYGSAKEDFYDKIDILIFPTHYKNEAEPLIALEAMRKGVPVIAYKRGCIPEIISADCGKIVPESENFIESAMEQIKNWILYPKKFEEASKSAISNFLVNYRKNISIKRDLLIKILDHSLKKNKLKTCFKN